MDLGTFSVSLAVADLGASQRFYETLGFEVVGGEAEENWLILQNGEAKIGLFHGMFDTNILTFNPSGMIGARIIQRMRKEAGLEIERECDESGEGPAHFVLKDPDGNTILVDQHE
ncbi:MAG: VOC family protein [Planctomycetota bacterium]|jgi:catechol 2,3-dioxygenase-like lactoylglutathione lyase family enzyme